MMRMAGGGVEGAADMIRVDRAKIASQKGRCRLAIFMRRLSEIAPTLARERRDPIKP
ncbi:hypothetical protein EMIT0111MI5_11093 [Burkholderia sp. IT-111MI5]